MSAPLHSKAVRRLILATVLWGLSFPTTRVLALINQAYFPDRSTWLFASICITYRFGFSTLGMLVLALPTMKHITRLEGQQGIWLGLFGGAGILFQADGLAHTSASTSAFLTQTYCLLIPLWAAWRSRQWPSAKTSGSCLLVIAGVIILAGVDWTRFRMGRGELETVIASFLFAGQILLLEEPKYANNNVNHFSVIMFGTITLLAIPIAIITTRSFDDWIGPYAGPAPLMFILILIIPCTFGGYLLMNRWQKQVTATEAGLIYCLEPVFASAMALFLPAWYGAMSGISYQNETLTSKLLWGGGLITTANMVIQAPARFMKPKLSITTEK